MKTMCISMAIALAFGAGIAAPAAAVEQAAPFSKFSSCKGLWKKFPNGVAENRRAARDVIEEGYERPTISRSVYLANYRKLDRDYTGVICPVITGGAFGEFILDDMRQDICEGMDVIGTPMSQRPSYCQP